MGTRTSSSSSSTIAHAHQRLLRGWMGIWHGLGGGEWVTWSRERRRFGTKLQFLSCPPFLSLFPFLHFLHLVDASLLLLLLLLPLCLLCCDTPRPLCPTIIYILPMIHPCRFVRSFAYSAATVFHIQQQHQQAPCTLCIVFLVLLLWSLPPQPPSTSTLSERSPLFGGGSSIPQQHLPQLLVRLPFVFCLGCVLLPSLSTAKLIIIYLQ